MTKKMFFWYMFESKEGKGKEKKKKKNVCLVCICKSREMKRRNVLFTLIPSLIGEVSKRPNRQNCNFERNKKSKNVVAFPFYKKL